jgi:hypothetical protein
MAAKKENNGWRGNNGGEMASNQWRNNEKWHKQIQ